jgi:hypothetical protein
VPAGPVCGVFAEEEPTVDGASLLALLDDDGQHLSRLPDQGGRQSLGAEVGAWQP